MQNKEFYIEVSEKYKNKLLWTISSHCNFNCIYCYNAKSIQDNFITKKYTPEYIADCFDKTEKSWLIFFLGGEPFLMPDFLPLVKSLTKNHDIQISTNLCSDDVYLFPNYVSPSKVMLISASFHVLEREKVDPDFSKFVEKYLFLKNNGYKIIANYVTWPPLFNRIQRDFDFLKSKGVDNIMPIPFRGEFNDKNYPYDYSESETEIIAKLANLNKSYVNFSKEDKKVKKVSCEAGRNYFSMDNFGNVIQCFSVKKSHGNLFEGTFVMNSHNVKCVSNSENWYDCYLGVVRKSPIEKLLSLLKVKIS